MDCFQILDIKNRVAKNIYVQDFIWTHVFRFLGQITGSRMAGSYGYIFLVLGEIAKLLSQVAASSEEV